MWLKRAAVCSLCVLIQTLSNSSVHLLFPQSLDELEDDDAGQKDSREEELVQANTFQNEAMTADPSTGHLMVRGGDEVLTLPCYTCCQTEALLLRETPGELSAAAQVSVKRIKTC